MNKLICISSLLATVAITGCTDAGRAQFGALGSTAEIICYSGGQVIYKGTSTGKIATEEHSDGWFFKDSADGKLVRVSGDCVIKN